MISTEYAATPIVYSRAILAVKRRDLPPAVRDPPAYAGGFYWGGIFPLRFAIPRLPPGAFIGTGCPRPIKARSVSDGICPLPVQARSASKGMRVAVLCMAADSLARASGLDGSGVRAVSSVHPHPHFRDHAALWRNVASADRSRLWRASVTDPMRPLNRAAGNKAR